MIKEKGIYIILPQNRPQMDRWRNGSASDSRSEGYPFESGMVQCHSCDRDDFFGLFI